MSRYARIRDSLSNARKGYVERYRHMTKSSGTILNFEQSEEGPLGVKYRDVWNKARKGAHDTNAQDQIKFKYTDIGEVSEWLTKSSGTILNFEQSEEGPVGVKYMDVRNKARKGAHDTNAQN